MSYDPIEFLGLKCNSNDAKFYICGLDTTIPGGTFLGCCASDPCASNSCPDEDLRSAGYDPNAHNYIQPQQCEDKNNDWWTCSAGATFLGCCENNPCQGDGRCNSSSLYPAVMSEMPDRQKVFFEKPAATTAAGDPLETDDNNNPEKGGNSIAVKAAAGTVGGVVGLLLIAGAIIFFLRRRRRRENSTANLPAAWRQDTSPDHPGAPTSPFLHDRSPTVAMSQAQTPHQDKASFYPSGVSSMTSQGYHPSHGPNSTSPYSTPFGSPGLPQTDINRHSTFSNGGAHIPVSPTQSSFAGLHSPTPVNNVHYTGQSYTAELGHENNPGQAFAAELPATNDR